MIAFFAATPFQAINCINIKLSKYKDIDADLFILSFAADNTGLVEICKNSGIFSHVEYLHKPFNQKGRMKLLFSYLFPDRETIQLICRNSYDEMFFSRIGNAANFYYTYLRKKNPNIRCSYYDEGIGDYIVSIVPAKTKFTHILKALHYKCAFDVIGKLWLYMPALRFENTQFEAEQIPSISENTSRKICSVFGISGQLRLPDDCRLIYMDQPFLKQQNFDIDDRKMLDIISSVVPKENIYVKIHPGTDNASRYDGYKVLPDLGCPWEVAQCLMNTSNLILVAVNSTAVVTPKTIFDKEPCVMLLYDIFKDKPFINIDKQRMYFSGVKGLYNDKSRFIVPQSVDEMTDFLKKEMLSL